MSILGGVGYSGRYAASQSSYHGIFVGALLEESKDNEPQDVNFSLMVIECLLHSLRIKAHRQLHFLTPNVPSNRRAPPNAYEARRVCARPRSLGG